MAQAVAAPAPATPTLPRRIAGVIGEMWQDKAGFFGLFVMASLILVALAAPLLAPHDPSAQSLSTRLLPPFWLEGGSLEYPLGTDNLGRDVLSRIVYGSRVSLTVGLGVVLLAGSVGTVLGLLAGYKGGRVDSVIMRWLDTQLAFPGLLLYLVILSVIRPSLTVLIIVLPINAWMVYALLVRGVVLSAKEMPYVEAADIVGARPRRIIFRHILPNLAAPILTLAVLEFASAILAEAALSFLGLGIQPPSVSWGLDVAIGRDYVFNAWWLVTFPGLAIAITVLGANLFASWLRVVADPHEREKRFAAGFQTTGGRGA